MNGLNRPCPHCGAASPDYSVQYCPSCGKSFDTRTLPCGCEVSERRGELLNTLLQKAMKARFFVTAYVYLRLWDLVHGKPKKEVLWTQSKQSL